MKLLTEKWEDEPRQLTAPGRIIIMIATIAVAAVACIKAIDYADKYQMEQLEKQNSVEWLWQENGGA